MCEFDKPDKTFTPNLYLLIFYLYITYYWSFPLLLFWRLTVDMFPNLFFPTAFQNKSVLNKKQREWIICSLKSILNILSRSVNNATLSIFTSSARRELAEMWELFLNVDFSSVTTIVLAELDHLGGHKTSLKHQIR